MIRNSLFTVSLLMLLVSSLNARANPFVPTKEYNDEKNALLNPIVLQVENKDDGNRTVKIIHEDKEVIKKPLEEIKITKVVPVKKDEKPKEIKVYKYNLLSFVNINITDDIMNIKTKYKLIKNFVFKQENKLVFDFAAKKRFYTKRETLSSHKDFKKIIIGAHPEYKYFRVVIVPKYKASNYKIIKKKDGLITIKRAKK